MAISRIEWTEMTWNPTVGCSKVSAGCKFCYAEVMTRRLRGMGQVKYKDGFKVVKPHPPSLQLPYTWRSPKLVFVNSMSDLFHHKIESKYIQDVFRVMNENPQHTFQVLTKRAKRLLTEDKHLNWSQNIWMGVSVEDSRVADRIEYLKRTSAKTKFLSLEPLIGPLENLNLEGINWVIVGGESGHAARPMDRAWVLDIQQQCARASVPFFFKQWGGRNKKASGRLLNGRTYDEMPLIY